MLQLVVAVRSELNGYAKQLQLWPLGVVKILALSGAKAMLLSVQATTADLKASVAASQESLYGRQVENAGCALA